MRLARLNFEVVSLEQPAFHRQRSLFPTTACMAQHAMRCHMGRFTGKRKDAKMFGCSVLSWIRAEGRLFHVGGIFLFARLVSESKRSKRAAGHRIAMKRSMVARVGLC